MGLAQLIGICGAIILVYMSFLFLVALLRRDNSIADIGWGFGFIVVGLSVLFIQADFTTRQILLISLVLLWGIRLSGRILKRNWGKGEDFRYRKWREEWGKWFLLRSYLQVFILQGFFMWLINLPLIITGANSVQGLGWLDYTGLAVWLTGFFFEAVGDWQLDRFLADKKNRGKILDTGLWRYTRHPNYFGEVVMWWGIYIISLSQPWGWAGIIGPITITVLILFVSGVPMLERAMAENPGYKEYARKTSIFLPLPPGK
jgi:steroid 5-alpha reductase family enzyme